jgi:hypothetical protein
MTPPFRLAGIVHRSATLVAVVVRAVSVRGTEVMPDNAVRVAFVTDVENALVPSAVTAATWN